jgi:integrase/recombinase XerD
MTSGAPNALARALRAFFADHLPRIRGASPHTLQSYRDALVLLLRFLSARHSRPVVQLDFDHLAPDDVLAFLDHLERDRGNCVSTRNARLAAIHAFARHAAAGAPEHIELCQSLLAIPFKRAAAPAVEYLDADEIRTLLQAPDQTSPSGRRDYVLLLLLFNTGARVQEVLDIRPCDLRLARPHQVRLFGKGRKERTCPLWPQTAAALRELIAEIGMDDDDRQPLFRNNRAEPMSRFGVRYILRKHALLAGTREPTLKAKRVHPHTMRHTAAVHLLQAGVDMVTISHWLGHASVETTNRYAAVDLSTKQEALAKAEPIAEVDPAVASWRQDSSVLAWLESL